MAGIEIEGYGPFVQRDIGVLEYCASSDAEILAAGAAVETLGLAAGLVRDVIAVAVRASDVSVGPALGDKPVLTFLRGVETLEEV